MRITNEQSGTNVFEIADGIFRISTPIPPSKELPLGFTFNQFLIVDEQPLLFHTGPRRLFPLVKQAIASVIAIEKLRYIGFSHVEADECGALSQLLELAPSAVPLCGQIAAMVSVGDMVDRAPRAMADGETLSLGKHTVRWLATPHLPHGWDAGLLMDLHAETLLCGDLFTQPGADCPAMTEADILGLSESMRAAMEYYSRAPESRALFAKLADQAPTTLACMHGSSWRGDGAALIRALADRVAPV